MTPKLPPEYTLSTQLRKNIVDIIKSLPRMEYSRRSNGEIDFYGASAIIAKKLKLEKPLYGLASWKHGWLWYDTISPVRLVESENKKIHNLVFTKQDEMYLKSYGYTNAVAVGAPFIYSEQKEISRIPNSILIFPPHSTQFCKFDASSDRLPYIDFLSSLKDKFSVVVASIGGEDVLKNKWVHAFEKAKIPWITGAWSYDKNALNRINTLMHHFEFVTSNNPGSHFAYAAYCGCKVSFWGTDVEREKSDLTIHPFYKKNPHIAKVFNNIDYATEFKKRYPFFFVEPWAADLHVEWARTVLGEDNKKQPEEIARLFGWNIQQTRLGRWKPLDTSDYLTNEELFAKALAKSLTGRHEEALKITNVLKRRHVRMRDVEVIRARYFLSIGNTHGAREALKEELRHYTDNDQARVMLDSLGGEALTPHVATNNSEKEFIDFYNRVRPFTRLNIKRARSLYDLAMRVCRENIPGNFAECGVAAGGSTMLLALVIQKYSRTPRKVFAFDTFTGMPDPGEADTANGVPADDTGWGAGTCAAPEEFVQAHCHRLGVGNIVETRKGLFDDTLPVHRNEIGEIALLHMDADWYSSTMTILDNLFEQLNDNALIQIDDYGAWDGCKKAILDYSVQHDLFFDVHEIDGTGVWCAKPTQAGKKQVPKLAPPRNEAFLAPELSPEFADLYLVRKAILDRLNQTIPQFHGTLLDLGCGQMPYREHILARNSKITRYIGLDFATGKYAERRQPDLIWDGHTIPLPDASVECAMATEVLEHCPDPLLVLKELRRVLGSGGRLFFTTPFLWPIHDAPHDHYRYTPYAMQRLLAEAGFEDVRIEALGGWNASLAQMIGLWLRRAPMAAEVRAQMTKDLFPFLSELVRTDSIPEDFAKNPMITSLAGTARVPASRTAKTPNAQEPRVIVVTDQFPVLSQTFILEQMTGLIDRGVGVEHWSLQRMDEQVVHDNVQKYGLLESTRFITLPPEALRLDPQRWTEHFLRTNNLTALDDVACVQIHFGPNFNKLAPLFAAYPDLLVLVSFHGYDGSATFKIKGVDVYKDLFARASNITTPSEFMKRTLVQHGCPPDKIIVHHYGKDTTVFTPTTLQENRQIRLLSVARFVEKKGLEYSLKAFAKAQDGLNAQYRIIGYGPLEAELKNLVHSLGVEDKVFFLGQLTNDAVRQEMSAADVFILTSVTAANGDQEGVPVSLIEAHALGLPVVSSLHAGIPELVAHGETGFLAEERNVEEIAGYLRALIKNPTIRKTFSVNARQKILREFDLAKLNDTLAETLLRKCTNRKQSTRTGGQKSVSSDAPGEEPHPCTVFCPICRSRHSQFKPFGATSRPNALCPNCTSLERHRALWVFLERRTDFFSSPRSRMLHFAPEVCLEQHFRQLIGKGYVTADLLDPRADVRADITKLEFPDASFDAVYCSHVLEHVPDDHQAMRELYRVLDRNGIAIIMVPLRGAVTEEDLTITDPKERTLRYGQADHVRYYGMDIVDRLQTAGFAVQCIDTATMFTSTDIATMRLGSVHIFLCRKLASANTAGSGGVTTSRPTTSTSSGATTQTLSATAKHWSTAKTIPRTRWWMHPAILRHINALVCGRPVDGPWAGLEQRMRELSPQGSFARGVSIGCGSASKELRLLRQGIVHHFDLFELSQERIAIGKAAAVRHGVADRVRFHVGDAFSLDLDDQYDLVYWNNALHHMFDVERALQWSRDRLRPGGWLVVDDYVGAARFQWPDAQLEIASRVRHALPERLLRNPSHPQRNCSTNLTRPSLTGMLATDPSEAADSDSILPALQEIFPDAQIMLTGGVVYNLALKDVIANFDDAQDAARLRELLAYDATLAAQGHTHYACAFAPR